VQKLRDQQTKVLKPLFTEVKIAEEITRRVKAAYDKNLRDFKALSNVIRIPVMTGEF